MEIYDDKWNEMDNNAIIDLHLALAHRVLSNVVKEKTVKGIYDTITKWCKAKLLHNKIFLKWRVYTV